MKRRDFLKTAALGTAAAVAARAVGTAAETAASELAKKLPRWRGFNLLEKFNAGSNKPFVEADFQWLAEWGFDFVRLPMDYRCWTDAQDPYKVNEKVLSEIDQAVEFGRKHKVHVDLNLHRAPGYTVASPPEKLKLWTDEEAQKQFDFQWALFAGRYKGIPSTQLSFDLVNEPADIKPEVYAKVTRRVVAAIRREDPNRLVVSDGIRWGNTPVMELADLGIAQSTRGYNPMEISHYQAPWVGGERFAKPTWPLKRGNQTIDREWLKKNCIEPWKQLAAKGVGVHVGEWGAFNKTPHEVVLAWARDFLGLWKEAGWGWAMWNFRGSFGILDSGRSDVAYEDFRGRKLDKKLLDLLQQF
jgi:endoglucanase